MRPNRQRSYLKRKRHLNDTIEQISCILRQISRVTGILISESTIVAQATAMARSIEAACYVSENKTSEDRYRYMLQLKTSKLCRSLIANIRFKPCPKNEEPRPSPIYTKDDFDHINDEVADPLDQCSERDLFFESDFGDSAFLEK
jgi:hypothetical protein